MLGKRIQFTKQTQVILRVLSFMKLQRSDHAEVLHGSHAPMSQWKCFPGSHNYSTDGSTHQPQQYHLHTSTIWYIKQIHSKSSLFYEGKSLYCCIISLHHKHFSNKLYKFLIKQILLLSPVGSLVLGRFAGPNEQQS